MKTKTTRNFTRSFLFIAISLLGLSVAGQPSKLGYSFGLKAGANGVFESYGNLGAELNFTTHYFMYSLGYNYNQELNIFLPLPHEDLHQANFLFGSFIDRNSFRFEYQAGVGMVWGTHRTTLQSSGFLWEQYDSQEFQTISLPLRVGLKYIPFQFMSVGLEFLVNINPEKTIALPMLTLNFGRIFKEKRKRIIKTNLK
jgi:hypothetical protein